MFNISSKNVHYNSQRYDFIRINYKVRVRMGAFLNKIKSMMVQDLTFTSLLRINNSYTTDRFTDSFAILSIGSRERAISRSETRECGCCYCWFVSLCIDCFVGEHPDNRFFFISLRRCSVFPSGAKKKRGESTTGIRT